MAGGTGTVKGHGGYGRARPSGGAMPPHLGRAVGSVEGSNPSSHNRARPRNRCKTVLAVRIWCSKSSMSRTIGKQIRRSKPACVAKRAARSLLRIPPVPKLLRLPPAMSMTAASMVGTVVSGVLCGSVAGSASMSARVAGAGGSIGTN